MPSIRKDRGNGWWARVHINGKQIASQMFPPGRKMGPEWTAAKSWEVQTKVKIEALLAEGVSLLDALVQLELQPPAQLQQDPLDEAQRIPSDLERLMGWGEAYLAHCSRVMQKTSVTEKNTVLREFSAFCAKEKIVSLEGITKPAVYKFLAGVADEKTKNRANVYRKNLLSAWNWGVSFIEGFPRSSWLIASIPEFPVEEAARYVPPEEDVIKVLKKAHGQDLVMLLTYYFTGGRRSELFRLSWEQDVRLDEGKLRLTDHKGKNGKKRIRWYDMHPELVKAYTWWWHARPCKVDNVFMQTHCKGAMGEPFKQRRWLMPRLCEQAGVVPFGFHGLRHKSAAITFKDGGLANAQILMGHENATTTDRYVKSIGLYTDQGEIVNALGNNRIGQEGIRLLQAEMPREPEPHEAFCNQEPVHNVLQ